VYIHPVNVSPERSTRSLIWAVLAYMNPQTTEGKVGQPKPKTAVTTSPYEVVSGTQSLFNTSKSQSRSRTDLILKEKVTPKVTPIQPVNRTAFHNNSQLHRLVSGLVFQKPFDHIQMVICIQLALNSMQRRKANIDKNGNRSWGNRSHHSLYIYPIN